MRFCLKNEYFFKEYTEGPQSPYYTDFGTWKKIAPWEICVSGTVIKTQIMQKYPTCAYLSQKRVKWGPRYWFSHRWWTGSRRKIRLLNPRTIHKWFQCALHKCFGLIMQCQCLLSCHGSFAFDLSLFLSSQMWLKLTLIGMREGTFYPLVLFGPDFVSWIFIKNSRKILEVKIDINRVNLTPCQAHWVL